MRERSSKSTGRKSRSGKTCGRSRLKATTPLTSSAEDSLAKTSASPERVPASPVQGPVFGTSSLGSFAQFGPDGWSSKTCQLSLLEGLEPFSETWPKSGLMRNGTAYRLVPLARRTDENASGLLPTPVASNGPAETSHQRTWSKTYAGLHNFVTGKGKQLDHWAQWPTPSASQMPCEGTVRLARKAWLEGLATLEEANAIAGRDVRDKQGKVPAMWPTPKASAGGPDFAKMTGRDNRKPGGGLSLATMAAMFPTPTVQDASNNGGASQYQRNSLPLNAVAGGALNPKWVEWLMGFPLGWTALDASETPSSRKLSKSSGGRSLQRKRG